MNPYENKNSIQKKYSLIHSQIGNVLGEYNIISFDRFTTQHEFLDFIKTNKNKKFIYISPYECLYDFSEEYVLNNDYRDKVESVLSSNNLEINLIYCGNNLEFYNSVITKGSFFKVHYWPTALLDLTHSMLRAYVEEDGVYHTPMELDDKIKSIVPKKYNHLYSNFNNKPRYHRCIMMDYLHKNNLLDIGINSWNNLSDYASEASPIDSTKYVFKYWNEELIKIDLVKDPFNPDYNYDFSDILFKNDSFLELAGESNHIIPYITEKSFRCLLIGKPFISFGSKNTMNEIKKMGFELYDEIFDYSFDSMDKLEDRIQGIVKELIKIKDSDFSLLRNSIEDKIKRNQERAFSLLKNDEFTPLILDKILTKL